MSDSKEIYEALQALNARLDDTVEQLLIDLVEKVRTGLRAEARYAKAAGAPSGVENTLKRWIEFDASERKCLHRKLSGPDAVSGRCTETSCWNFWNRHAEPAGSPWATPPNFMGPEEFLPKG